MPLGDICPCVAYVTSTDTLITARVICIMSLLLLAYYNYYFYYLLLAQEFIY